MKEVWQSYSEDDFKQKKTTTKQPETNYTTRSDTRTTGQVTPGQVPPEWQFKRKKRPVFLIVLFAVAVMSLVWTSYYFVVFRGAKGMQLKVIAMAINKTCPRDLNEAIRWDNVKVQSDNTLLYNFTMLQPQEQTVDTTTMKSLIRPALVQMMQANENSKYFRQNEIVQVFCFHERSGAYLYQLVLTPDEYQSEGS